MELETDEELLALVAKRNPDALMVLYRRYNVRVYSLIFHLLKDAGAAEEVLQDTFQRLWERHAQFDGTRGVLLSWLFTVARNLALDRRRHESHRGRIAVVPIEEKNLERCIVLESPDLALAVREALSDLPQAQREAIELAFFDGLTHQELAERLDESLGTVKTRIRLGLGKIKAQLAQVIA
jgi:RNA polymerase sigma-70 factor (ECF subfamily)